MLESIGVSQKLHFEDTFLIYCKLSDDAPDESLLHDMGLQCITKFSLFATSLNFTFFFT